MLFDHGCDSVTSVLFPLTVVRIMRFPPNQSCLLLLTNVCFNVYYNFLQEFYTGSLQMGELTGPDDLNLGIICLYIFTGIFGSEVWETSINLGALI